MVMHELTQNSDGTLRTQAPEAVKDLFSKKTSVEVDATLGDANVNNGTYSLCGAANKAIVTFKSIGKKAKINAEVTLTTQREQLDLFFILMIQEVIIKLFLILLKENRWIQFCFARKI